MKRKRRGRADRACVFRQVWRDYPHQRAIMGDIIEKRLKRVKRRFLPIQRMFSAAVARESDNTAHLYLNFLKDGELEGDCVPKRKG